MSLRPSTFAKSNQFDDGGYLISDATNKIPVPPTEPPKSIAGDAAKVKEWKERQAKAEKITNLSITLVPLDENNEPVGQPKTHDLKLGVVDKVRPSTEPSDNIKNGSKEYGAQGPYMVPFTFCPHESSKSGHFLAGLQAAGMKDEEFPEDGDVRFLIGLKLRIRPVTKTMEGVKRKQMVDGVEKEVDQTYVLLEPYQIIERPRKKGAKAEAAAANTKTAVAAKAAEEEAVEAGGDDDEDEDDMETKFLTLLRDVITKMSGKKKAINAGTVGLEMIKKISTIHPDEAKAFKAMLKDEASFANKVEAMKPEE